MAFSSARATLLAACLSLAFFAACSDSPSGGPGGGGGATATTCATQGDCENGFTCDTVKKVCVSNMGGGGLADATGGGEAGATGDGGADATSGGDSAPTGDTADASGSGGDTAIKDTTPAPDAKVNPGNDLSCKPCTPNGSECTGDFACVNLLSGPFCAKKCSSVADCTPGYICDKASAGEQKYCVLNSYDCKGCAVSGCPEGEKCNFKTSPPACLASKKVCEACQQDKDCDNGLRCVKFGDAKVCTPDCSAGQACPENSTCVAYVTDATKACAYAAAKCCYGTSCTSGCTNCKGKCIAGQCQECSKNADCPNNGTCNLNSYTCVTNATCPPADKPNLKIKNKVTNECVECTNDTHCTGSAAGPKCNLKTNVCEKSSASNECSVCGGDYPGCIELNGTWTCVECTTDDDCAKKNKGTCLAKSYTCQGSTGGSGGTGAGPKTGTCKADSDCKNDPNNTFKLSCDAATGLCYDVDGKCDNIVAFCNAAKGSNCELASDLFGGGGLPGGLPGLPGGGGGPPAANAMKCTCGTGGASGGGNGWQWDATCDLFKTLSPNLANCDCSKDPQSKDCAPAIPIPLPGLPTTCCKQSGGGSGTPSDTMTCILTGMQPKPDPMCFGGIACSSLAGCLTGKPGGSCGKSPF
ncbi:MAG: hypothetical protein FJ100_09365 [Deltaproteobacteria bacterium]|nr:hypothetical protein [Deltaproteobacteria bacterium]